MFRSLLALSLIAIAHANPLFDGADPHAMVENHEVWIYPTEPSRKPIFAAYRSTDLKTWQREGPILDLDEIPWVKSDGAPWHAAWAPAIAKKNNRYYFYFSVGPQNPTPSRIGVAVGDSPAGPFRDIGKPILTGNSSFEAIDPMVFTDPASRKSYFYAGGSAGSKLRIYEMADDMISLGKEIQTNQPDHFTEGAFVHLRNGIYYLSYSHGRFNDSSYSVHYATSSSPTGPWKYRGKILASDATRQGPGHHAFIESQKTKEWFIVYHRWDTAETKGPFKGRRKIAIEKIAYDSDGLILPIPMTDG